MPNDTSDTLYEKLEEIKRIKDEIKEALFEVGGYEFFQNDPLFQEYPDIITQIFLRIGNVNRVLDVSVYGRDPGENIPITDTTYTKLLPYLEELQLCRTNLINNLNTKGVPASSTDTLSNLVAKVLDISGGVIPPTPEPTQELLSSFMITADLRADIYYRTRVEYTGYTEESIQLEIYNIGEEPINMFSTFYSIKIIPSYETAQDFELWNTVTRWSSGGYLYPGSYMNSYLFSVYNTSESQEEIIWLRNTAEMIKNGLYVEEIDEYNVTDARIEHIDIYSHGVIVGDERIEMYKVPSEDKGFLTFGFDTATDYYDYGELDPPVNFIIQTNPEAVIHSLWQLYNGSWSYTYSIIEDVDHWRTAPIITRSVYDEEQEE
ncbi:MAG: hypothetical protein J6T15_05205 [Bacilli bacterium]|nr:hypothetical protein [Bacilli bacterium]